MGRTYSFIPSYYTLVIIPLILIPLSTFCRMEEDFMDLVREQFQSDTYLVRRFKLISNTFLLCLQKDDNMSSIYHRHIEHFFHIFLLEILFSV